MVTKLEWMEKGQHREDKERAEERGLFSLTREEKGELALLPSCWEVTGKVESGSSCNFFLCCCFNNP